MIFFLCTIYRYESKCVLPYHCKIPIFIKKNNNYSPIMRGTIIEDNIFLLSKQQQQQKEKKIGIF